MTRDSSKSSEKAQQWINGKRKRFSNSKKTGKSLTDPNLSK